MAHDEELAIQQVPANQAMERLSALTEPTLGLDLTTLATVMVQSGFFPNIGSVSQGIVKILAGRELGFGPVASLRHIYVHKGHIGIMAQLIASRIRQSGRYDYKILKSDETVCEIEILRARGGEWMSEGIERFTIEEAKRAGLIKADSAWLSYPSDLLFARAITRAQRRFAPDVFGQAVYTEEELRSIPESGPAALPESAEVSLMPRRVGEPAPEPPNGPEPAQEGEVLPSALVEPESPGLEAGRYLSGLLEKETPAETAVEGRRQALIEEIEQLRVFHRVKAPYFAHLHGANLGGATYETATVEQLAALRDAVGTLPAPAPPPAPALPPPVATGTGLTFLIGTRSYSTAGIDKETLLAVFKLEDALDKKTKTKGFAKAILKKEFGLETRTELTHDQGWKYAAKLKELVDG